MPGQDRGSALLDVARTVVRRAERAAAAGRRRRLPRHPVPQPPLVAAVDPRPLGRGRAAALPRRLTAPDPEDPCPSPSSSPAPPPTTSPPRAVGVVAGQTCRRRRRLGLPRGRRASRARRARCASCPAPTAAPPTSSGLGPAGEVDAAVLRCAAGSARPRRQAPRVARRRPARRRRRPGGRRPAARRPSSRASCSAATSTPPSSRSPSPPQLARVVLVGAGGKRVAGRRRPRRS